MTSSKRMKAAQEGNFTMDAAREIMNEVKKGDLERVTFRNEQLRRYFPRSYTAQQMQDTIIKLLDQWQKRNPANTNDKHYTAKGSPNILGSPFIIRKG